MSVNTIFRGEAFLITFQNLFMCFLVDFSNNLMLILFDTIVVAETILNTLGVLRQSRVFQAFVGKPFAQVLLEQGMSSQFDGL